MTEFTEKRHNQDTVIALIQRDIDYIKNKVEHIDNALSEDYVSRVEFDPIKRIVYGLVALVMSSVVIALVAMVLRGAH